MPSRRLSLVFVGLLVVIVLVFFARRMQNPLKVPIVRSIKVLDITSTNAFSEFACPEGLNYFLVIGVPRVSNTNVTFDGSIILQRGDRQLTKLSIAHQAATSVNLLDSQGLDSYIVHVPEATNKFELNTFLMSGQHYQIIAENFPIDGSLWLFAKYPSGWEMPFGIGKRLKEKRKAIKERR